MRLLLFSSSKTSNFAFSRVFLPRVRHFVMSSPVDGPNHLERTVGSKRENAKVSAIVSSIGDVSPSIKHIQLKIEDSRFKFKAGQCVDFFPPGFPTCTGYSICSAPGETCASGVLELAVKETDVDHPITKWVHDEVLQFGLQEACPLHSSHIKKGVDMFIPGVPVIGGFSMCSTMAELVASRHLDLAVKYSEHPPAYWVWRQCKKGDCLMVRAGGDCFYDPSTQEQWQQPHQLLLIAGGIGINPLLSILKVALAKNNSALEKVTILYSVARREELIFKDIIHQLAEDPKMHYEVFVTQEPSSPVDDVKCGRLTGPNIKRNIETAKMDIDKIHCFLCGPGQMMEDMENFLTELGIQKERILYEKWW